MLSLKDILEKYELITVVEEQISDHAPIYLTNSSYDGLAYSEGVIILFDIDDECEPYIVKNVVDIIEITPLKFNRELVVICDGIKKIKFFCKKPCSLGQI